MFGFLETCVNYIGNEVVYIKTVFEIFIFSIQQNYLYIHCVILTVSSEIQKYGVF